MTPGLTPSQTVGPYLHIGLAGSFGNELVPPGTPGAVELSGSVLDGAGIPVPDALVEVWAPGGGFGRSETVDGGFAFVVAKPAAGYLEVVVFARGLLKQVVTRMYFPDEADAVPTTIEPARRSTLVASEEGGRLRFDIRLQGDGETVFFGP